MVHFKLVLKTKLSCVLTIYRIVVKYEKMNFEFKC